MGNIFKSILNFIGSHKLIVIIALILAVGGWYFWSKSQKSTNTNQPLTATANRGTLIQSVSASGQVVAVNSVPINTSATGVVKTVNVENGDLVTQGEIIATLTLDQVSQQKQVNAYSSLLSAENTLASDQADLNTLQNTEFTTNQKLMNDAVARDLTTTDPTYIEENAAWLAAEQAYKNQAAVISQAQAAVNSAQLSYMQASSSITAPVAGIVEGLTITPGTTIAISTSTTSSPQTIGNITQPGPIQASVDVSEVDSVNVNIGQKATLTLDAFPNETFTGKVLSIDTSGVVSSGVTTYPAVIAFDSSVPHIYPNMAVNATIITGIKNNVLLIPSTAIQSQNGQSYVRVLKNSQVQVVPVQTGAANDTETEITSGLSSGDKVVTSFQATQGGANGSSPFGLNRGGGGGGAGGRIFRIGG